jgi:hypothetical protein
MENNQNNNSQWNNAHSPSGTFNNQTRNSSDSNSSYQTTDTNPQQQQGGWAPNINTQWNTQTKLPNTPQAPTDLNAITEEKITLAEYTGKFEIMKKRKISYDSMVGHDSEAFMFFSKAPELQHIFDKTDVQSVKDNLSAYGKAAGRGFWTGIAMCFLADAYRRKKDIIYGLTYRRSFMRFVTKVLVVPSYVAFGWGWAFAGRQKDDAESTIAKYNLGKNQEIRNWYNANILMENPNFVAPGGVGGGENAGNQFGGGGDSGNGQGGDYSSEGRVN